LELENLSLTDLTNLKELIEKKIDSMNEYFNNNFEQDINDLIGAFRRNQLIFDASLVPPGGYKYSELRNGKHNITDFEIIINPILFEKNLGYTRDSFIGELEEYNYYVQRLFVVIDLYESRLFSVLDSCLPKIENNISFDVSETNVFRKIKLEADKIFGKEYKDLKKFEKTHVLNILEQKFPNYTRSGLTSFIGYISSSKIQTKSKRKGNNPTSNQD